MAWQDREYARPGSGGGSFWPGARGNPLRGRSVVSILIWVNIAVFVLCTFTIQSGGFAGARGGSDPLSSPVFRALAMHAGSVLHGEVWRILTAQYLHWSFWHIFMNMLGLHFLGRALENDWGPRRFFAIYTVAGTLGMIALTALTAMGWLPGGPAAGASGCVLGLLGAAAVLYPNTVIYIQFFLPIKIRTAAYIFAGIYALNLYQVGPNAGGDACHLVGLLFGAWWAHRGAGWWDRVSWRWSKATGRPRRVHVQRFNADAAQSRVDESTIDRILKKVHEGGLHSLSETEKQALREATDRQRTRDARPSGTL